MPLIQSEVEKEKFLSTEGVYEITQPNCIRDCSGNNDVSTNSKYAIGKCNLSSFQRYLGLAY